MTFLSKSISSTEHFVGETFRWKITIFFSFYSPSEQKFKCISGCRFVGVRVCVCVCVCESEGAWGINDWLTPTPYILTHTLTHTHTFIPHSHPQTLTPYPHPTPTISFHTIKWSVDEVLCRRKFFDKNLSTICLSTNFFRRTTYLPFEFIFLL